MRAGRDGVRTQGEQPLARLQRLCLRIIHRATCKTCTDSSSRPRRNANGSSGTSNPSRPTQSAQMFAQPSAQLPGTTPTRLATACSSLEAQHFHCHCFLARAIVGTATVGLLRTSTTMSWICGSTRPGGNVEGMLRTALHCFALLCTAMRSILRSKSKK